MVASVDSDGMGFGRAFFFCDVGVKNASSARFLDIVQSHLNLENFHRRRRRSSDDAKSQKRLRRDVILNARGHGKARSPLAFFPSSGYRN